MVLTMQAEPSFAREALSAGARGYVLKEAAEADLVEAVRSVLAGGTYLDPSLGARLARMAPEPTGAHPGLSHGEPNLALGTEFAGHRIDAFVGQGGMGLVFRATDLTLGRTVALKVIAPDAAGKPAVPRPLRARVPGGGGNRSPPRRPDLSRRPGRGAAVPDDALCRRHRPAPAAPPRGAGSTRRERSRSSARSPARSTRRTRSGSSTATSSPATYYSPSGRGTTTPTSQTSASPGEPTTST